MIILNKIIGSLDKYFSGESLSLRKEADIATGRSSMFRRMESDLARTERETGKIVVKDEMMMFVDLVQKKKQPTRTNDYRSLGSKSQTEDMWLFADMVKKK